MTAQNKKPLLACFAFVWMIVLGSSCRGIKNMQYLQGTLDTAALSKIHVPEPVIQKGDLLAINVYSDDARATASVINPNASAEASNLAAGTAIGSQPAPAAGYLVNQQGEIQLFKLGRIPAFGKTRAQLADTLELLYAEKGLLKNPFVDVRFLNYKVTIIGEVNRPGLYSVPADKVSAFEAIGLAGDVTQFGRRDNVLVVREVNGVRTFGRLNLSKPDVFLSPYFYLQQNDMVVVDVGKNKAAVNNQTTVQRIAIATAILSTVAIFINVFK